MSETMLQELQRLLDSPIPDRTRPLLGVKQLLINETGRLISPNRKGYVWRAKWKTAKCSPGHRWERLDSEHRSPHPDCTCGIQVGYDLWSLTREGTIVNTASVVAAINAGGVRPGFDLAGRGTRKVAYALMAVDGFVRKFDNLMKVEKAMPLALVALPDVGLRRIPSNANEQELVETARRFRLDVVALDSLHADDMRKVAETYNCDYWCPSWIIDTERQVRRIEARARRLRGGE